MKKTIIQTVEKEIDVPLPYFSKSSAFFYKVFGEGENDCLRIFLSWENQRAGISTNSTIDAFGRDTEECTEQEFNEAEAIAKNILSPFIK